jgi:hypothetical protein
MKRYKAFIVVGYRNWGKSETLHQAFPEKIKGWVTLIGKKLFMRRMSNSDNPESYELFIRRMSNSDDPKSYIKFLKREQPRNLIITFNPDFDDEKYKVKENLSRLDKTHDCYFYVLKNNFNKKKNRRVIKKEHIDLLKGFGEIKIIEIIDRKERGNKFKEFIVDIFKRVSGKVWIG